MLLCTAFCSRKRILYSSRIQFDIIHTLNVECSMSVCQFWNASAMPRYDVISISRSPILFHFFLSSKYLWNFTMAHRHTCSKSFSRIAIFGMCATGSLRWATCIRAQRRLSPSDGMSDARRFFFWVCSVLMPNTKLQKLSIRWKSEVWRWVEERANKSFGE